MRSSVWADGPTMTDLIASEVIGQRHPWHDPVAVRREQIRIALHRYADLPFLFKVNILDEGLAAVINS